MSNLPNKHTTSLLHVVPVSPTKKQIKKAILFCSFFLVIGSLTGLAQTDEWAQKADVGYDTTNVSEPATRAEAVGFSIGTKGYIGTGGNTKDFWEYDPSTNTWTQKADFGGTARSGAVGFSIGSKGYIGTGSGVYPDYYAKDDFWEYDPATNTWTQKADFGGAPRWGAIGFSIGNKGYIGTGYYDGCRKDFWEYDPSTDKWTQKADFGGTARSEAVGFNIGSKGYIGTGSVCHLGYPDNYTKDFWEYDPAVNTWTQKADFGGNARYGAVGIGIGSKGYVGIGRISKRPYNKDFWEFDPVNNTWTKKADIKGTFQIEAVGFSIGGKGYTGTGYSISGLLTKDFWEYDPFANTWTQKADFGANARGGAVGFSIGTKGYIGTGGNQDFWEYDPATNTWTQKADFGGTTRSGAVGFSIGSKGYIGTGSVGYPDYYTKDFWEYDPAANTWTRKADFGGVARSGAVGFSIGGKGYLGTGDVGNSGRRSFFAADFWEYDPATDTWTQKAYFVDGRSGAVGFSIGSKGYLGMGSVNSSWRSSFFVPDFWEYDPATDTWTQKADLGKYTREGAVGFSIGSRGYLGTGYHYHRNSGSFLFTDFWEYDPAANTWTQKSDFGGGARNGAVGFSIGTKGYIGTGGTKDFWEYTPGGCPVPDSLKATNISDICARLNWHLTNTDVQNIKISYRPLGDTTWKEERKKPMTDGIRICGLTPNTTYEWKVANICADEKTDWVKGANFTTRPSTAIASIAEAFTNNKVPGDISVHIMPNPTNGNFSLQMHLPDNAALTTLTLYNNLGVKVWQQNAGKLSGFVNRNIALESKLSAGVYVLMVQHGDTRLMKKVVVVK